MSLVNFFQFGEHRCPTCNNMLDDFDPSKAPKNVVISSLLETIVKMMEKKEDIEEEKIVKNDIFIDEEIIELKENISDEKIVDCSVTQIKDMDDNFLPLAELKLSLEYKGYSPKSSLFIVVVDKSGSMSGKPWVIKKQLNQRAKFKMH
jgi:hypothetical protein